MGSMDGESFIGCYIHCDTHERLNEYETMSHPTLDEITIGQSQHVTIRDRVRPDDYRN